MNRGTIRGAGLGVAIALALVGPTQAQDVAEGGRCLESEQMGSLGITGIKCDRCRFITEGGASRAVFFTEPTILSLDPSLPASRVLRPGDVIVALEGQLITTAEGSARYSSLPPNGAVSIRVRRDGRLLELTVPLAATCPRPATVPAPDLVGQTIPDPAVPPLPPEWTVREGRVVAPVPVVEPVPTAVPEPPRPAQGLDPVDLPPLVSLGFGFQCSRCTYQASPDGQGVWSFSSPPNIFVTPSSEAWREGLRSDDEIIAIAGRPITSDEGGRHFAALRPGDNVTWTVVRRGDTLRATTTVQARAVEAAPQPSPGSDPSEGPLRFSGTVGTTAVEVRGGRVTVTESPDGRLVIIRTRDTEIRLVASPGRGRR
jgi:hypothetical protein